VRRSYAIGSASSRSGRFAELWSAVAERSDDTALEQARRWSLPNGALLPAALHDTRLPVRAPKMCTDAIAALPGQLRDGSSGICAKIRYFQPLSQRIRCQS